MPSTTTFEFGQIVLVRFPLTADKPIIKKILESPSNESKPNFSKPLISLPV